MPLLILQVSRSITKLLDLKSLKMLDSCSAYNPSPLTLRQLVEFGRNATEVDSFNFVRQEVPVRLANIMKEINLLPPNLLKTPSVVTLQVRNVLRAKLFKKTSGKILK